MAIINNQNNMLKLEIHKSGIKRTKAGLHNLQIYTAVTITDSQILVNIEHGSFAQNIIGFLSTYLLSWCDFFICLQQTFHASNQLCLVPAIIFKNCKKLAKN